MSNNSLTHSRTHKHRRMHTQSGKLSSNAMYVCYNREKINELNWFGHSSGSKSNMRNRCYENSSTKSTTRNVLQSKHPPPKHAEKTTKCFETKNNCCRSIFVEHKNLLLLLLFSLLPPSTHSSGCVFNVHGHGQCDRFSDCDVSSKHECIYSTHV